MSGYAVAIWSFLYMLLHIYLALGGTMALATFRPGIALMPQFRQINGLASVGLAAVALFGVVLARSSFGPIGRSVAVAIAWLGCSLATAHGLVGIATRAQTIAASSAGGATRIPPAHLYWDMLVYEPWFLIEGLLLGTAGWYLMSSPIAKRRWIAACATGVSLGIVTAVLRVKIG